MIPASRILVLAPHTDDGELGCGGFIAKFCNEEKEVYYAAFSPCIQSLPKGLPADTLINECKKATTELGIPVANILFFDFEVRKFSEKRQAILEELVKLKLSIQPDLVLLPSSTDVHQDHKVIYEEGVRAFKHSSILGYELPWNQTSFSSDTFIRLTKNELDKKVNALSEYKSQAQRNYMQADFIYSLAKVRGVQAGSEWAEAFETIKLII
ncbi:MAG: PIG-L family deacetylase [Bacteroidetes bacterium]|nr:PIG-L family deacetylase [Bacteroidota bacterium]